MLDTSTQNAQDPRVSYSRSIITKCTSSKPKSRVKVGLPTTLVASYDQMYASKLQSDEKNRTNPIRIMIWLCWPP